MGTNYYLRERTPYRTTVIHEGDEHGPIIGIEREYRSCHLCKLSGGWKPTLAADPESTILDDAGDPVVFWSFRDMMGFIRAHVDRYMIHDEYADGEDEYGNNTYKEISPDEFERLVREWGAGRKWKAHTEQHLRKDDEGFEFENVDFC